MVFSLSGNFHLSLCAENFLLVWYSSTVSTYLPQQLYVSVWWATRFFCKRLLFLCDEQLWLYALPFSYTEKLHLVWYGLIGTVDLFLIPGDTTTTTTIGAKVNYSVPSTGNQKLYLEKWRQDWVRSSLYLRENDLKKEYTSY